MLAGSLVGSLLGRLERVFSVKRVGKQFNASTQVLSKLLLLLLLFPFAITNRAEMMLCPRSPQVTCPHGFSKLYVFETFIYFF